MDKAIEAAARAILNHEDELDWHEVEPEPTSLSLARAAIRAYLSALKEDPDVVERVARAIHENWEVKKKGRPAKFEERPTNTQEAFRSDARAALSALEIK